MITNRIGRHEVLLPINHNYRNLLCLKFFKIKIQDMREFLIAVKKTKLKKNFQMRSRLRVLSH